MRQFSKVLYPNDETESGKGAQDLCSRGTFSYPVHLQDLIRRFRREHNDWKDFSQESNHST